METQQIKRERKRKKNYQSKILSRAIDHTGSTPNAKGFFNSLWPALDCRTVTWLLPLPARAAMKAVIAAAKDGYVRH